MTKLTRKQTGSPGKTDYSRKGKRASRIINPWGRPIPARISSAWGRVSGSSRRQSTPSPELAPQTKGYPRNKPSEWPVVTDVVGHTKAPPTSGYTSAVAAANNAAVEHAFTRAKYQSSP